MDNQNHVTIRDMLTHPGFDPIIFSLGPIAFRWYGLMYLIGFLVFLYLGKIRARREDQCVQPEQVSDLLFYGVLGVVIGGRLGSVFFYNLDRFVDQPLYLFKIWEGGMSFHGGLIGVVTALWWYQHKYGWGFLRLCDFVAPLIAPGLGLGRIGNFINAELWGKPTDVPWGMVFPHVDQLARHPSQLYQVFLEGIVLFVLVWWFASRPRPAGAVCALFVLLYGLFRFLVEFYREPDRDVGYIAFNWFTMGQLLSLPMILIGLVVLIRSYRISS